MKKSNFLKMFAGVLAVVGLTLAVPVLAQSAETDRTAGQVFDDVWITSQIKAKYAIEPGISVFGIKVECIDGVVTLSGKVDNISERSRAEALAADVNGVKRVINDIVLKSQCEEPQPVEATGT